MTDRALLSAKQHPPRVRGHETEDRFRKLRSSCTDEARYADDLTCVDSQVDTSNAGFTRSESTQLKHYIATLHLAFWKHTRELAAHHQLNELFGRDIGHLMSFDRLAVTKNGYAIGDHGQFFEPVRNVDHPDAGRAKLSNYTR